MERKRKILFIVEAMGGGVFTYIVDLANGLIEKYDLYIAYAIRSQTPLNFRDYFDKRIRLIEVKNFTRSLELIKDIKAFLEIRKIAEDIRPDVIHLHSSKAGVLGRWAFNGKKTPLFYTPHGYSFLMKNHGLLKRSFYKMIETVSAKRSCMTISCSKGEHQETLKLTKCADYVNNGINIKEIQQLLSLFQRADSGYFTVFTLGRVCYQKNPMLFNEIAEALPMIHFLWIGDGELKGKLTSSNIEITGWLERKDALAKCFSADVFMLTSLWEGLPISLLEAMYMKKPCVVNDVIGSHDVIHSGLNGFVCKSVSDFVEAIEAIQAGKGAELAEVAYKDILHKYNTNVMVEKYVGFYEKRMEEVRKTLADRVA